MAFLCGLRRGSARRVVASLVVLAAMTALLGGANAQTQNATTAFVENPQLTRVRGSAIDVAITVDGWVYSIDPEGSAWVQKPTSGGTWTKLPGVFRAVRAGLDGSVRAIGTDNQLYVLNGSWWRSTGAVAVRDVAVTPDGNTYVLSLDGALEAVDATGEVIGHNSGAETGDFQSVVVDEHGLPWLWNTRGGIKRFDGLNWVLQNRFTSDGIRSLATAVDGTVILIDGRGAAHRWRSESADWQPEIVSEPMRTVAIGPGGKPWYLSESGSLWASASFSGTAVITVTKTPALFTRLLSWKRVNGQAESLSVGADATVMSIDSTQNAWRWKGKEGWTPLPGKFKRIAAGKAGTAWGVDSENRVLRYAAGQWFDSGVRAAEVAVGPQGDVWVITSEGTLGRYDVRSKIWSDVESPGHRARFIAVGNTANSGKVEEPWIIDANGFVSRRIVDRWVTYPGIRATSIAVGPEGTVYATTATLELFWFDLKAREWKPATGAARSVAVGPGGTPWMVGQRSELYVSTAFLAQPEAAQPGGTKIPMQSPPAIITIAPPAASILPQLIKPLIYTTIPGNYVDVGIGAEGSVLAAGVDGALYCFDNTSKRFQFALAGSIKKLAVAGNGAPWIIDAQGRVAFFEKDAWRLVLDFKANDIAIGQDGGAYATNAINDLVYRFSGVSNTFELVTAYGSGVPLRAKSIAFVAGQLWAVTPAKQLLKCEKDNCQLQIVSATDVSSGPEGSLFITDLAGGVQRWNARGGNFISVKGRGVALSVGPQGLPWLVSGGGQIFSSGLFALGNKAINTSQCALKFQTRQLPVTVAVTPPPVSVIIGTADSFVLSPGETASVLDNDRLNGVTPSLNGIRITFTSATPYLSLSNGRVLVAANAPNGSVLTATYTICAALDLTKCATVPVTVTVPSSLSAVSDIATLAPGATLNLLANDRLNRASPSAAQVSVTFSTGSAYLTQSNGVLTLAASAPLGSTQSATYSLCLLPANTPCSGPVSVTITVPGSINATSDVVSLAPGASFNLLANDSLNGVVPLPSQVNVTFATTSAFLSQSGGLLRLAANAPSGSTQRATYSICSTVGNSPCSGSANVIVTVPGVITAAADSATLSPGDTLNLLNNDTLNGTVPKPSDVVVKFQTSSSYLTQVGGLLTLGTAVPRGTTQTASYTLCSAVDSAVCSAPVSVTINVTSRVVAVADVATLSPGATLDLLANDELNGAVPTAAQVTLIFNSNNAYLSEAGGVLSVSPSTPAGTTQTASYRLCERVVSSNCSGVVPITITVPSAVSAITAVADSATLNAGGTFNLLANDSLNGATPLSSQVVVTFNTSSAYLTQVGGLLTLAAGAPLGSTQTATYSICQSPANTPCSGTVSVTVTVPGVIAAVADAITLSPGGTTNLLANDSLNGVVPLSSQVAVTFNSASAYLSQVGGVLTLAASAPAGSTQTATYSICQSPANTLCSGTVAVTITVPGSIIAVADSATVVPGGTFNLLANDSLNGAVPLSSQVTVTFQTSSENVTQVGGLVTLSPAAAAGTTHIGTYSICQSPANTLCSATVGFTISAPSSINATADAATLSPGGTLNLLANDNLNGGSPDSSVVTVTFNTASPYLSQVGGLLTLAAGAQGGSTQTATYRICRTVGNSPCSGPVSVTITVAGTITAVADAATVVPGGTFNLLANDSLNGAVPLSSQVTVTFQTSSENLTQVGGLVTLSPAAAAGTMHIGTYSICQSPANTLCSATVGFTISAPSTINAVADAATLSPGGTLNLLANDNLNGGSPDSSVVTVTFNTASPYLSQVGGLLTLAAGAPGGSTQTATYSICRTVGNSPCSGPVSVTITVPISVVAVDDGPILLYLGGGTRLTFNLSVNDTLRGAPVSGATVVYTVSDPNFTVTAAGVLTTTGTTPVGFFTLPYRVCEIGVPTNCVDATADIEVQTGG